MPVHCPLVLAAKYMYVPGVMVLAACTMLGTDVVQVTTFIAASRAPQLAHADAVLVPVTLQPMYSTVLAEARASPRAPRASVPEMVTVATCVWPAVALPPSAAQRTAAIRIFSLFMEVLLSRPHRAAAVPGRARGRPCAGGRAGHGRRSTGSTPGSAIRRRAALDPVTRARRAGCTAPRTRRSSMRHVWIAALAIAAGCAPVDDVASVEAPLEKGAGAHAPICGDGILKYYDWACTRSGWQL